MVEKLKKYIELTGVKKLKIAEQLGITNVYLSYILSGDKTPSIDLEQRIKNLVG